MTHESRLPGGGENLFQGIKAACVKAEKTGRRLVPLSIGQPTGPAFYKGRVAASQAIMAANECMHEYQDNGSPGVPGFARRFVQTHVRVNATSLDCLPIPGIKPMLGLIPLACGGGRNTQYSISVLRSPGYPTPGTWCEYLRLFNRTFSLGIKNKFRFDPKELKADHDLVMTNYPHNPSGQVATREWWEQVCERAERFNIRIFNDAAYSKLAFSEDHCTLTDVAVNFPNLSWVEAFSASKAGNFTGWRVGALAGSADFIEDIATIKGNTDSGFFAPAAAGVLCVFEHHSSLIDDMRETYKRRSRFLIERLEAYGMRLAVCPSAGFFTLWQTPKGAFIDNIRDAEHFNHLMIKHTGIVGVHFPPYIRYAVCADVESQEDEISAAFKTACVGY